DRVNGFNLWDCWAICGRCGGDALYQRVRLKHSANFLRASPVFLSGTVSFREPRSAKARFSTLPESAYSQREQHLVFPEAPSRPGADGLGRLREFRGGRGQSIDQALDRGEMPAPPARRWYPAGVEFRDDLAERHPLPCQLGDQPSERGGTGVGGGLVNRRQAP